MRKAKLVQVGGRVLLRIGREVRLAGPFTVTYNKFFDKKFSMRALLLSVDCLREVKASDERLFTIIDHVGKMQESPLKFI